MRIANRTSILRPHKNPVLIEGLDGTNLIW
jgi:hypothetical protein